MKRTLLLPIKVATFIYRFLALMAWTAYVEANRDISS
jgi:hypothetical protein